jgi:hypothetical protein
LFEFIQIFFTLRLTLITFAVFEVALLWVVAASIFVVAALICRAASVVVASVKFTSLKNWSVLVPHPALVLAHFISHLASHLAPTELPLRLKSIVPVYANMSAVNQAPVEQVHSV